MTDATLTFPAWQTGLSFEPLPHHSEGSFYALTANGPMHVRFDPLEESYMAEDGSAEGCSEDDVLAWAWPTEAPDMDRAHRLWLEAEGF